jgi:hypothetical protein
MYAGQKHLRANESRDCDNEAKLSLASDRILPKDLAALCLEFSTLADLDALCHTSRGLAALVHQFVKCVRSLNADITLPDLSMLRYYAKNARSLRRVRVLSRAETKPLAALLPWLIRNNARHLEELHTEVMSGAMLVALNNCTKLRVWIADLFFSEKNNDAMHMEPSNRELMRLANVALSGSEILERVSFTGLRCRTPFFAAQLSRSGRTKR